MVNAEIRDAGFLSELMPSVTEQLSKSGRSKRWAEDPVAWAEEYLGLEGQVWGKMRETMYSVRDNYGTGVAASHGVSKSYTAGLIAGWWIATHPLGETETFVATTAPSKVQVDAVWSYIRSFHMLAQARFEAGLIEAPLPGYLTSGAEVRWKLPTGETIAQGRKPPDNKSDIAFQGRHATNLLFIGDEATGLNKDMLEAGDNIATGARNRQLLLLNPTDPSCEAAKMWPRDDDTEKRDGRKRWNFIRISMFDSPLVTLEEGIDLSKVDGMSGPETIERYQEKFAEDDPQYISRVLGLWPWGAADGILFSEETIARAHRTCGVPDSEEGYIQFGVDVARSGKDHSVVYQARFGQVWEMDPETDKKVKPTGQRGVWARKVGSWHGAPLTGNDPENPGTAERVAVLARAEGANRVNVDVGGFGIAVVDELAKHALSYDLGLVYGQSTEGVDKRAYINTRAMHYGELRRKMFKGEVDLDETDDVLTEELQGIRYDIATSGALKIEAKDDMKRRGAKSPDFADALWYSCFGMLSDEDSYENGLLDAGDVLTADIEDLVEHGSFYFGSNGIGQYGW